MLEEEEVEWESFIEGFKPTECHVVEVDGKLVCEGKLNGEKAVCDITEVNGKPHVSCRKILSEATSV